MLWPRIDMAVSGWFYKPDAGFIFARHPFFLFLQSLAYYGARSLGVSLAVMIGIAACTHKSVLGIGLKGWVFLLLGLVLGPGLIANVALKDHWGRARPREVVAFGGHAAFSPALIPQTGTLKNESFVAGDPAFGFYLSSFAYVAPRRSPKNISRKTFWGAMAIGVLFGFARLAMGAHFLSDIFFAALFMLASMAGLHGIFFGLTSTLQAWREWLFLPPKAPDFS